MDTSSGALSARIQPDNFDGPMNLIAPRVDDQEIASRGIFGTIEYLAKNSVYVFIILEARVRVPRQR